MRGWKGFFIVMLAAGGALAPPLCAQPIRLGLEGVPLEEALDTVRTQTGIDIVFAERLVKGRTVHCRYEGREAQAALSCVLEGTRLRAERVRRRQFVLVAAPDEGAAAPGVPRSPPPRGVIAGFVADAETGEVLPGAHVYLPELRAGAAANDAGYFALPDLPHEAYPVRISHLGYQTKDTMLTAGAPPVSVRLAPKTLRAADVVVEAGAQEEDAGTALPGRLALSPGRLDDLPAFLGEQDLFQALQWMPGIRKSGEVVGGLSVRGGQTDQNLYLMDGVPVYHPWHAFSLISTFQTETFKDAKLYRSAFPAEHGGRLASVLDAQMKDGNRTEPKAVAALSAVSGRFLIESPVTPTTSFMIAGRRSYLDKLIGREHPVEASDGRRDTLRTGYYFYDLSAKLTTRPSKEQRLSLSYYHGRDDLDLRLPFDLSLDFSSWLRPADLFFEVGQGWENRLLSGRHQYLPSDRVFLTTTVYYSGYRAREGAFVRPTASASLVSDYRVRLYDLGAKLDVDYYHTLAHQVRAGVQVVAHRFESTLDADVERTPGLVEPQNEASQQRSLELVGYVQDEWKPSGRLTVQPGLRASFFSSGRYARVRPRLSVQYEAHPEYLTLRSAADLHVQYMQRLRDRYSVVYDLASSRWIPASEEVQPASSAQLSLEAESQPLAWLRLRAGAYARRARHVLVPEDIYRAKDRLQGPGIGVSTLVEQYTPAQARAYGFEAEAEAEHGPWRLRLNYTGGRSLLRAPELGETRYRPDHFDIPRALRSAVTYADRRFSATLAAEARSGAPNTVPVARYQLGDPLDEEPTSYLSRPRVHNGRLPPYLRFDAALGYRFRLLSARWRARLHVYNLTSRRNVVSRQYVPLPEGTEINDRGGLPLLPLFELEMRL